MNAEPMTPEQIQAALASYNRKQQQQRQRQANYYQRHADKRKAYAKEYYQKRKTEAQAQVIPEAPALGV
jgi:hypothetical protein